MKIAIIRQRYNPFGGAERFVERALEALANEGAEITLITRNWSGAPQSGFRQVICDPAYSSMVGGRGARDRSFSQAVQAEMLEGGYDITQSHERIPGCMIFRAGDGVHAAWMDYRLPILNPLQRLSQRWSGYHRYVLQAEREMYSHPALRAVICNSRMVANEIQQYYGVEKSKLHIIYNGVDTTTFHPGLAEEFRLATREALAIPEQAPLLLYVGSGYERKGVPQLLAAFRQLAHPAAHLVIVGADRKLTATRSLVSSIGLAKRVHCIGPVGDVRPYYGAADAFVLPTLYDPCPNAALEAMACGLPIVTSTRCGAQEWVETEGNGWVIDPLDGDALSRALAGVITFAGDPVRRQLARKAVETFTLEAMSGRLLRLYDDLLASGAV